MATAAIGPTIPHYKFTVDGYSVPNLTGILVDGENTWNLIYDERFGYTCADQDLHQLVWWIANIAAVNAGFTHHGKDSRPLNPHTVQVMEIGSVETEPDEGDDLLDIWGAPE